jgi:xanthine/CO dehydrogenase XdhC/CoxF family maturation factor
MHATETELFTAAQNWLEQNKGVALATVIETWGSSPRPVGSHLLVNDAGEFLGSVSGGCVETALVSEAREIIQAGVPRTVEFGVSNEMAWEVGLSCGGKIRVYVEVLR